MWNKNIDQLERLKNERLLGEYLLNIAVCFELSKDNDNYTFIDSHFFYGSKKTSFIKTIGICYKTDKKGVLIYEDNFDRLDCQFNLPICLFPVYNTVMQWKNQLYTIKSKVKTTTCTIGDCIWGLEFNELKKGNILVQNSKEYDEITFILPIDIFMRVMIGIPTLQSLCLKKIKL
jgi:hypothetical protein